MTGKKDDFEKQLEEYLKDSEFARAFEKETRKLRLALGGAEAGSITQVLRHYKL